MTGANSLAAAVETRVIKQMKANLKDSSDMVGCKKHSPT